MSGSSAGTLRDFFAANIVHLGLLAVFSVLIVGGLYSRYVMMAATALIAVFMVFTPLGRNVEDLFYLLAFENVFKISAGSSSMFTYLQIIALAKLLFARKKVVENGTSFTLTFLMVAYCALISFTTLTSLVKFGIGLFLLFFSFAEGEKTFLDKKGIVIAYCFGILISSLWALTGLSQFARYISSVIVRLADGSGVTRFSGLLENPNYYSMEISFALAALAILYLRDEIRHEFALFGIPLLVLGSMSQSKAFLLTLAVEALIFFFYLSRKSYRTLIGILFGAAAVYVVFNSRINSFIATYFSRVTVLTDVLDDSSTLAAATTGRSEIWRQYLIISASDARSLMLGRGMDRGLTGFADPHNMFIELLFTLGIVGMIIYYLSLYTYIPARTNWKFMPILILAFLMRAFAANIAYYNNTWYYYILILVLLDDREAFTADETQTGKSLYLKSPDKVTLW